MEFLQKHLKIFAGAAILLLTLAWLVWPQGDLPRATRLMKQGEYEEAALILDRIVSQRPANRDIQILHARALIGAGRFEVAEVVLIRLVRQGMDDELEGLLRIYREAQALRIMALLENDDEAGERLLGKMVNQYLAEEFKEPILFHARRQAELEEWAKVVQAWQWYIKGGWEPPLEFQSHLAKSLQSLFGRSDITEGQREFVLEHLDPGHPLAKLDQLLYLKYRYHEISLAVAQDAIQFLNEVSWRDYGEWIESIVQEISLWYKTMEHLWLVAEGKIQPLQGLTPEEEEYVLEFCWSYLRGDLNSLASNRNGDFTSTYAQFLKDPQEFFAYFQDSTQWVNGEPWLRGRVMVWRAAALGQAGASEAASYVAGRLTQEGQLIAYAQQEGEGTVSWSGDGDFCALRITNTPRPTFLILEKDSGRLVLQLADDSSLKWAPQGNAFITYSNDSSWQYHAGPGEDIAIVGPVSIAGWYDSMTLYTWDYQLYDLEHNQVGKLPDSFTHYWRIDISSAGLLLCYGEGGTNLFNQDHQLVTSGKGLIHQPPWSPSGQKALLYVGYKYSVISQEGIQDLPLPSGSRVQGWMDEDRLLVKRELGYPDNWYVYTISTDSVQYIHPPEGNPESLYPAGDGKTVAWSTGGIIYLGRLKLDD